MRSGAGKLGKFVRAWKTRKAVNVARKGHTRIALAEMHGEVNRICKEKVLNAGLREKIMAMCKHPELAKVFLLKYNEMPRVVDAFNATSEWAEKHNLKW